ncbi:MAG: sugar ABC transporter permease [Anaerolineae bacterium]|nr:sugar ABC transporter permease [Anaerolineae bacterium]
MIESAVRPVARRAVAVRRRRRLSIVPYLFIFPAVSLYAVFNFGPVVATVFFSFFRWENIVPTADFVGLKHYIYILRDPLFWNALGHNVQFLVMAVIVPVWTGLFLAVLMAELPRGRSVYRSLLFLPAIFSGVVIAYVWQWIYHPFAGILNQVLKTIGLDFLAQSWLGEPRIALFSTFVAYAWASYGYSMVIFLAGLQAIDPEIYDAATMDGVNFFQKLFYVTVPSLRDVFTFVITLRILTAMGVFGVIFILTGGGPFYATDVISVYVYRHIGNFEMGWATASATINTIIIVTMATTFIRWRERKA